MRRKKVLEASLQRQERQKRKDRSYAAWVSADIDAFLERKKEEDEKKAGQNPK